MNDSKDAHQAIIEQRTALEAQVIKIDDVAPHILTALSKQQGFSLIRLGDGEILLLAQDIIFPTNVDIREWGKLMAELCHDPNLGGGDNEVARFGTVLRNAGVGYPDKFAQDCLINAIKTANFIGIPVTYRPGRSAAHCRLVGGFQTVFIEALNKLAIPLNNLQLTDSAAHYLLHASGWLRKLLLPSEYPSLCEQYGLPIDYKPRILLVGDLAKHFSGLLNKIGCNVTGTVHPVGMYNIDQVSKKIEQQSFDLALVSAGIAAKYICTFISGKLNKVALDTGRLFDILVHHYGHLDNTKFTPRFDWML